MTPLARRAGRPRVPARDATRFDVARRRVEAGVVELVHDHAGFPQRVARLPFGIAAVELVHEGMTVYLGHDRRWLQDHVKRVTDGGGDRANHEQGDARKEASPLLSHCTEWTSPIWKSHSRL